MGNKSDWQMQVPRAGSRLGWLMEQPSLTAALKSMNADFSVKLLYLGLSENDFGFSDRHFPQEVFVRDVLLFSGGRSVVWARSLCCPADESWCGILDCGTQPLGDRLFGGKLPLRRTPFEFRCGEGLVLPGLNAKVHSARRSVFEWDRRPLGLVECFLSDFG